MAVTHKLAADLISAQAKEGIASSKFTDGSFGQWALDAAEDLMDDIATENQQFHDNLIVSNGDAYYSTIQNSIPAGQLTMAFDANSIYIRQSDLSTREANRLYFAIIKGTVFKFINKKQVTIWYSLLLNYIAISHLEDQQAINPNTARASLISKRQTDVAADIVVMCADAAATYKTRTGFANGVEENAYDPVISLT